MKTKKITIWSTKGGVGKTSICAELHFRLGYPVVTNESRSMLRFLVDEKYLKLLEPKEKIADYKNSMLFDFGGFVDQRILDALKQSDIVIIPTTTDVPDLEGCIDSFDTVRKYNQNVKIIINKVIDEKSLDFAKSYLDDRCQYIMTSINQSKAFSNMHRNRKGIYDMAKINPLLRFSYRKVLEKFEYILRDI